VVEPERLGAPRRKPPAGATALVEQDNILTENGQLSPASKAGNAGADNRDPTIGCVLSSPHFLIPSLLRRCSNRKYPSLVALLSSMATIDAPVVVVEEAVGLSENVATRLFVHS
jgi:hypothetical protein